MLKKHREAIAAWWSNRQERKAQERWERDVRKRCRKALENDKGRSAWYFPESREEAFINMDETLRWSRERTNALRAKYNKPARK